MFEPISISGIAANCLTNAFLAGVAGNLFASALYDAGKHGQTKLGQLVVDGLKQGQLPENHDLAKLAQSSLRSALFFVHASCARSVGPKDPFFPALPKAWKEGQLFERPLIQVSNTEEHQWVTRFGKLIKDGDACHALSNLPSGIEDHQLTDLAARQLDTALDQAVTQRLAEWAHERVGPPKQLDGSVAFEKGLKQGFAIDGDPQRRLSVYQAWCLFFREGLKDAKDERPFKAYVIAKLEQLGEQPSASFDIDAWGETLSEKLVDALSTSIPDIKYFDDQFAALGELVREVAAKEADRVIDAVHAAKPSHLIPRLPPLQNEFIGRSDEKETLIKSLVGDGDANRVAGIAGVGGQGGIGKTALALAVGHALAGEFPAGRVYIDLLGTTDPLSPRAAMESILRQFNPPANFKDAKDDQLAAEYRSFLGSQQVLLLLDNAEDAKQVIPLLPGGSCAVIVTSRKHFNLQGKKPLTLELLSEADAVDLAQSIAPRLAVDEALDLVQACGRLALAVRLVATQIREYENIPAADEIAELRSDRLAYLDTVDNDDPGGLPFVRRAIELSLEKLSDGHRGFWARLSVFPVDFEYQFASYVGLEDAEPDVKLGRKLLEELRRHALLEFDGERQRYRLHDLAREYAQTRLLDEAGRFDLAKRHASLFQSFLAATNKAYLDGRVVEGLDMLDAEMPSVLAGQAWAAAHRETNPDAGRLAADYYDAGVYVLTLRLSAWAQIDWLETAAAACRAIGDRRGEGNALGNLGNAHAALGDARKAIEYHEQALTGSREIGDRHGEGAALGNLGNAHAALGDARKAIEYYEQALTGSRETGDRRGEGGALGNLGVAHANLGDARKAIEYHEQHLNVAQEIGDRRGEGNALGNLGLAHADLGDARKAVEFYEKRLVIAREIGDRRGEGRVLGNLGLAHADLGDARKAIEFYEKRLVIAREIGDRRGEGNALGNLGLAHAALGDARKAIEFYEKRLVIAREIGDRRGEGNVMGNLGNAHADLGDARKAIEFYDQQLIIVREIGDRRGEGNALGNLGLAHAALGDARKAIEFYDQQLIIVREIGDRRGEGNALGNRGSAHAALGDARKAIEFYEQHLNVAREIGDRRGESNALFNRAVQYAQLGEGMRAADDMERAAVIFAAIESPNAERAQQLAVQLRQMAEGGEGAAGA